MYVVGSYIYQYVYQYYTGVGLLLSVEIVYVRFPKVTSLSASAQCNGFYLWDILSSVTSLILIRLVMLNSLRTLPGEFSITCLIPASEILRGEYMDTHTEFSYSVV